MFTFVIIASSAVLLIFLIAIVMFRCQTNIRNIIYLLRVFAQKKRGYCILNSSEDFEFDAFIVYCDADSQWVHNILLQRLEANDLKICIHHRDFDVGESITENIKKYMDKSWKIVVIMSNDFTKSEWCQWEVDLIQERRRRYGKDTLVLIMYRQIDTSHMTNSVKALLDTTPHLTYKDGFGEDVFWSAVTRSVVKSFTDPPTAVL
jgi:toll-like receptor 13